MEPITRGMQGPAVEDVQTRLAALGFTLNAGEVAEHSFGTTTEEAVRSFRVQQGLAAEGAVDLACWSKLVDASYRLGDRTLYLRLPNFHGADVQTLQDAGAKATFFIGGSWADDHNGELLSIVRAGHEVGSHGYFHKDGDKLDLQGNLREVRSANALLQAITGEKPQLFAPPSGAYGEDTLQACRQEGMKVIMWSKDTIDWRDKDEELVYARATDGVKAGDLILMHPTAHTANALPRILRAYERSGLKAVTVSELVDIKI